MKTKVFVFLIFGAIYFGYLWGKWAFDKSVIWNKESEGLETLIEQMAGDDSERLAMVLVTENKAYALTSDNYNPNMMQIYIDPEAEKPSPYDENHPNNW